MSQNDRVYHNGWIPYKAIPDAGGAMRLLQLDTGVREHSINDGKIDFRFEKQASFFRMWDQALDVRESMTLPDPLDDKNHRIRELSRYRCLSTMGCSACGLPSLHRGISSRTIRLRRKPDPC